MENNNEKSFKVMSYNIAGLPLTIDLNSLPKMLKFIPYLYKLFTKQKSTVISFNPYGAGETNSILIGKKLNYDNIDIIGVQEDFNYHEYVYNEMKDTYRDDKWLGGIDLSKIWEMIDFHKFLRLPSWKSDGLGLFTKKSRIIVNKEEIITWNNSYGYISNCNDSLTNKGFRYYNITLDNTLKLDVYIIHTDASLNTKVKSEKDVKARQKQLKQLTSYILSHNNGNPIIVLGDFNGLYSNVWDSENIYDNFVRPINATGTLIIGDAWVNTADKYRNNPEPEDIDKIFYINNENSKYILEPIGCSSDYTYNDGEHNLSDHNPIVAEFRYTEK